MNKNIETRINNLIREIKFRNHEAMLVFSRTSIQYLTGFTGEEAQLLVQTNGSVTLFSDSRFISQIKAQVPDFIDVVMKVKSVPEELGEVLRQKMLRRVLIEGDFVTATFFNTLQSAIPNINFTLVTELVERLRLIKDDSEITLIKEAVKIAEESFNAVLPKVVAGRTELEIAADLEYEMKSRGASGPSFPTIIASGFRSAWPHGEASSKKVENHELITFDFGAVYQGYVSDVTRTVALGKVDHELEEIYRIVEAANEAGIRAVQLGKIGQDVDDAARSLIKDAGFGQYFGHGIGHGIGLDIHEINSPTMKFKETKLASGMVVTVEPGIYLPDKGGVRIEDDILVGNDSEILTSLPKQDLIVL